MARNIVPKRFVAFLRGINVGGSKPLKMDQVQSVFEDLNYSDVKSVLASGNIIFSASGKSSVDSISKKLSKHFESELGMKIPTIVRGFDEVTQLVKSKPFASIKLRPNSKLHVTFFSKLQPRSKKTPYEVVDGIAIVTQHTRDHICVCIHAKPGKGTPNWMKYLEREFGSESTTRTWGTIEKIVKAG